MTKAEIANIIRDFAQDFIDKVQPEDQIAMDLLNFANIVEADDQRGLENDDRE